MIKLLRHFPNSVQQHCLDMFRYSFARKYSDDMGYDEIKVYREAIRMAVDPNAVDVDDKPETADAELATV